MSAGLDVTVRLSKGHAGYRHRARRNNRWSQRSSSGNGSWLDL